MRRVGLLILPLVLLGCSWLVEADPTSRLRSGAALDQPISATEPDQAAVGLIVEVNRARQADGLDSLAPRADLMAIAEQRGQNMVERGYFAHVDPFSGRVEAERLMREAGYTGALAEVLYASSAELAELAQISAAAWLANPENRETLLAPDYRYTGAAVVDVGSWWYVIQVFAERAAP